MNSVNKLQTANISLVDSNKEVTWALPKNCVWFTLQVRGGEQVRMAFESGHVASSEPPYFTIGEDSSWSENGFNIEANSGISIFFASSTSGVTIEALLGINNPKEN